MIPPLLFFYSISQNSIALYTKPDALKNHNEQPEL